MSENHQKFQLCAYAWWASFKDQRGNLFIIVIQNFRISHNILHTYFFCFGLFLSFYSINSYNEMKCLRCFCSIVLSFCSDFKTKKKRKEDRRNRIVHLHTYENQTVTMSVGSFIFLLLPHLFMFNIPIIIMNPTIFYSFSLYFFSSPTSFASNSSLHLLIGAVKLKKFISNHHAVQKLTNH